MSYACILLGWIAFGLIHSLTASLWLKQRLAGKLGRFNRYYRLVYNGIAVLTFLPVLWLHQMVPVDYIGSWQGSLPIGYLLTCIGLVTSIVALWGYDLAEFIGWPVRVKHPDKQDLRQNGLLRYVRHPLYTGIILSLLGVWISHPTWSMLILLLAATLYIRIGIHFEERKLIAVFGNAYEQYRQRVPMLLPPLP